MPPPNPQSQPMVKPRILSPRDAKSLAGGHKKPEIKPDTPKYASLEQQKSLNRGSPLVSKWHLPSAFSRLRERYAALPSPVRRTFRVLRVLAPIIPISLFFSEHVAQIMWVRGPSMTPYLNEDYDQMQTQSDMVLVNMWPWGPVFPWARSKRIERGMVVTFRYDPKFLADSIQIGGTVTPR